ncbi:MAG: GNAT family N-acetyltransferase [Pseudomonadota bacterium]|nr:GNAT family N-acetyltransferase [Pseudomonadota bacterium]
MQHSREKIHPMAELGDLDPEDYKTFYDLFTHEKIIPYLPDQAIPKSYADAKQEIIDLMKKEWDGVGRYWGIYHCGCLIGTVGFHTLDQKNKSIEISYEISPDFWGKGIATHAVVYCIEYAKVHFLNIDKVIAYTLVDNIGSHRVAEKSGFKRIRICKNDCFYHGKIIDRLLFEIDLRDDQEQSN